MDAASTFGSLFKIFGVITVCQAITMPCGGEDCCSWSERPEGAQVLVDSSLAIVASADLRALTRRHTQRIPSQGRQH